MKTAYSFGVFHMSGCKHIGVCYCCIILTTTFSISVTQKPRIHSLKSHPNAITYFPFHTKEHPTYNISSNGCVLITKILMFYFSFIARKNSPFLYLPVNVQSSGAVIGADNHMIPLRSWFRCTAGTIMY